MPYRAKFLIVGDSAPFRRELHGLLFSLGYEVGEAITEEQALALCRVLDYDAVLFDARLPGGTGTGMSSRFQLLFPHLAIVFLDFESSPRRWLQALTAQPGVQLSRAFDISEPTPGVQGAPRCEPDRPKQIEEVIAIGHLSLNVARRVLAKDGRRIHLTRGEFDLLHRLMMQPGIPVAYRQLQRVLGHQESFGNIECLRTFVRQLRLKIEDDPSSPGYLFTTTSVGYYFVHPDEWVATEETCVLKAAS